MSNQDAGAILNGLVTHAIRCLDSVKGLKKSIQEKAKFLKACETTLTAIGDYGEILKQCEIINHQKQILIERHARVKIQLLALVQESSPMQDGTGPPPRSARVMLEMLRCYNELQHLVGELEALQAKNSALHDKFNAFRIRVADQMINNPATAAEKVTDAELEKKPAAIGGVMEGSAIENQGLESTAEISDTLHPDSVV